jgi:hypothetical protein
VLHFRRKNFSPARNNRTGRGIAGPVSALPVATSSTFCSPSRYLKFRETVAPSQGFVLAGTAAGDAGPSASSPTLASQSLNHEFGEADTHPVETIGAVKNENSIAHCTPKRKIAASRLYGPAPAETNMISMNAYRTSGRYSQSSIRSALSIGW